MNPLDFAALFAKLGICRGDVLFVHASMHWIGGRRERAVALIDALLAAIGPEGTLLMPSYTWRGAVPGHPQPGSVVDLQRTRSAVGLLSETFRRYPGVKRSLSYLLPVCGLGPHTEYFFADQQRILSPASPGSLFMRALDAQARLVGLGVSLNTSGFAHFADVHLANRYPVNPIRDEPLAGTVIDYDEQAKELRSMFFKSEVIKNCKPSALFAHSPSLNAALRSHMDGNTLYFSYPSDLFFYESFRVGDAALARGDLPPWLADWTPACP